MLTVAEKILILETLYSIRRAQNYYHEEKHSHTHMKGRTFVSTVYSTDSW